MTSKIKVDNINKVSDDSNIINKCGTNITMGQNGDTVIIPNGVTEQVQSGGAIQVQSGGSITIASGATITNNGTAVGLGRTGTVDWLTGSIKTSTFTAANGVGYFADTSGGAFTMNLPAGVAGNIVSVVDYTNTFDSNALTVSPNGTDKLGGTNATATLSTIGQSVTFVFVDSTEGWKNIQDSTSNVTGNPSLQATGGTITTCGNCKIHTFTGPGTFTVAAVSSTAPENIVSYMIVAGGGGGGSLCGGGGGGAGGFREVKGPAQSYTASPLDGFGTPANRVTVTAQAYPIVVGAGGAGGIGPSNNDPGCNGSPASGLGITSTGGGGGGAFQNSGQTGGSGGGGGGRGSTPGSAGNTPPVSPSQGNGGGQSTTSPSNPDRGGGGGAAGGGGRDVLGGSQGAQGGDGVTTSIGGSAVQRAGGGGGGWDDGTSASAGGAGNPSGTGGTTAANGGNGNTNTGGGGGGSGGAPGGVIGGTGGSGIVIIRYKFQ